MPTYKIDKAYTGPQVITLSVYLMNRGLKGIFKPRSKIYVTVDLGRHMVFLHDDYVMKTPKDCFSFAEINQVNADLSKRHKEKYYTDILAYERSYRFLFKNVHEWYLFTEAFRHVHKDFSEDTLFTTNESYLQFVISYLSDQKDNKYDFESPDARRIIDSQPDSDEEGVSTAEKYSKERAPDTLYSADIAAEDQRGAKTIGEKGENLLEKNVGPYDLNRTDGDKFNPNNPNFDKSIAVNVDNHESHYKAFHETGNPINQVDLHQDAKSNLNNIQPPFDQNTN